MRLNLKQMQLLSALILLSLPAVARADGRERNLAGAGKGSSFSADIALKVAGNRADLIAAATAGRLASEPSTGLLLLIGVGLIGAASLISLKIGHSDSVDGIENAGETAILTAPNWRRRGPNSPKFAKTSTKSTKMTARTKRDVVARSAAVTDEYSVAAVEPRFGSYGSYRAAAADDRGQRHHGLLGLSTK